mmetsp:Transcript_47628/g.58551  ORF Transcript_47628/g.58551 Transcript_47628/m.58551 type:complete len:345 (-) Transcript_47628:133-1167(-)
MSVRQAPGGASSICLGLDDSELKAINSISSNAFASNACQNSGNVLTERPSTMLLAPPGGRSTICLGEAPEVKSVKSVPPGGKSSICFGMDSKEAAPVSSNAFACGISQNCGNVLTERPTTLLHAPPGGHSTISLGHDAPAEVKSESRPVGGEDHIRWDPIAQSPASHRIPAGGKSSICLGENVTTLAMADASESKSAETSDVDEAALTSRRVPAGGASTVCLGTDISEWSLSSRALGRSRTPIQEAIAEESVKHLEADAKHETESEDCKSIGEDPLCKEESLEIEKDIKASQPIEDLAGVILGAEKIEKDDAIEKVQSETTALQDLPTPARRAPPGGVATVLLG